MALALLDENAPPESFAGRLAHPASPLFKAWANETGGSPAPKILKLWQLLKSRYARARIEQIMKLTQVQFEGACKEVGGDPGWRLTFEDFVAATFVQPCVPPSAMLLTPADSENCAPVKLTPGYLTSRTSTTETKAVTLSMMLGATVNSVYLPDELFASITTVNPFLNELTPKDKSCVASRWAAWTFAVFGMLNVGAAFRQRCAKLIKARLPHIGSSTWDGILMRKGYILERGDATVPCLASLSLHAISRSPLTLSPAPSAAVLPTNAD